MEISKFSESGGEEILSLCPAIDTKKGKDVLRKVNGLLRYHFKIDPASLSDEEFAEMWQQLKYALDFESRRNSADASGQIIYI